jgi:hypothetical protein
MYRFSFSGQSVLPNLRPPYVSFLPVIPFVQLSPSLVLLHSCPMPFHLSFGQSLPPSFLTLLYVNTVPRYALEISKHSTTLRTRDQ